MFFFFFFFQAEDGIRDHCVTGVQTCALPISPTGEIEKVRFLEEAGVEVVGFIGAEQDHDAVQGFTKLGAARSEERRVGKECRSRWAPYHEKKKKEKRKVDRKVEKVVSRAISV